LTEPGWLAGRPVPDLRTEVPGPAARKVLDRDAAVTSPSLPRAYPLVPRRGSGAVIEDVDGNLFLDFNAGIAVCSTGHAHPRVVQAVRDQAGELLHYSASDFYLPIYSELCEALAATAPMRAPVRAFLTNSGTEAVEGALKLARAATGRQYVIGFWGGFHGRSYGSVSLTASKAKYHTGFGPLLPGVLHAPYGYCHRCPLNLSYPSCGLATVDWLENTLFRYQVDPAEVAAVVVEPIQGEGGYIAPPPGWLAKLKATCERHGILLVVDEVQSGAGRTGRMWAIEHAGVEPDVLVTAKGIASGLPLGAFLARADLWTWPKGAHGSTYGGSPVPCAAGLATLAVLREEGLLANATARGEQLREGLERLRGRFGWLVEDVRGVGLMLGLELPSGELAEAVQLAAFRRGLLVLEAGESAVRLSPPLVVTAEQCGAALRLLDEAVEEVAASAPAAAR
jgi:4-aminobutyrate aminotransferase